MNCEQYIFIYYVLQCYACLISLCFYIHKKNYFVSCVLSCFVQSSVRGVTRYILLVIDFHGLLTWRASQFGTLLIRLLCTDLESVAQANIKMIPLSKQQNLIITSTSWPTGLYNRNSSSLVTSKLHWLSGNLHQALIMVSLHDNSIYFNQLAYLRSCYMVL